MSIFKVSADFKPAGDQPKAIKTISDNLKSGLLNQVLLGVTGSGKTYTVAKVIEETQRPAIIMAPNKTLAAQLYGEFKDFFPNNRVEYFISYYDYYQPEAYVPSSDTYIAKDSNINEHIEQMRLSATKALIESNDTIVVASVSAIYGLGDPKSYLKMVMNLSRGEIVNQRDILRQLSTMQYSRNDLDFQRANFRVIGNVIDIFPAEAEKDAIRVELEFDKISEISIFDPLTGAIISEVPRVTIFPKTHYVTPQEKIDLAIKDIRVELGCRLEELKKNNKLLEAQRLEERTNYDLEMMAELGFCNGVENYSRYLDGRDPGTRPFCLLDYFPDDYLMVVDESHVTISQVHAMYGGDRSRKENLVNYGFRLPAAMDNRPLKFEEFEALQNQVLYVSATPADYELKQTEGVFIEQVIRPTGLLDPEIEIRPSLNQIDDLIEEIQLRVEKDERTLVTTLTKRMAEELTKYFARVNIRCRYIHSDVDTLERVEIMQDLRKGLFDVLVGVNLLREGLDLPEVSLVAILDADKEGFLRSHRSLTQTVGRAARNVNGRAIMYADKVTNSMQKTIDETLYRREKQQNYNVKYNITPTALNKSLDNALSKNSVATYAQELKDRKAAEAKNRYLSADEIKEKIRASRKAMEVAAKDLDFIEAARLLSLIHI